MRAVFLEAGVLFLGQDPAQRLFQAALEVTQRALLPEGHELVRAVEKRNEWRCTGPEQGAIRPDLQPDVDVGEPLGLRGTDVHIAVAAGAVEAVQQQLAAESPGDRGVAGQVEGHPDRIRIAHLVPEFHRDTE